ncbi:phosphotransferase enzyme family protein [Penicillium pulvis]|uniref:phosphotransferase enzyme family protein n=1 Tax=Penicillium pulvis TaxID=1562058 RepID=UPI002547C23F|nr:phosphotransferase enzyme family protein [Penicillium pulvis]KAJ5806529.1 phosphotransferase enzyme family protein [Penicillium pulvis]
MGMKIRLALVKVILQGFGLQVPLEASDRNLFLGAPPHTAKPPSTGASTLVLRLSNPQAMGLNQNRVQNEVAAMSIARAGLRTYQSGLEVLVPAIYAWKATSSSEGTPGLVWILMEYKSGVSLDEHFPSLCTTKKKGVLEQIADVIVGIERSQLPLEVNQFGGLTIDNKGSIISGEMTIVKGGGPWKTYEAWWQDRLQDQLKGADKSPVIEGWRPDGDLRQHLEEFIAHGLSSVLTRAGFDSSKRVLIHGDFTMNNMLVDPDTDQLTAVLDFDFSYIAPPPAHLFFTSLQSLGTGTDPTGGKLTKTLLTGTFEDISDMSEKGNSIWWQA